MPLDDDIDPERHSTSRGSWHVRFIGPQITAYERRRYLSAALRMASTFAVVGAVCLGVGWAMRDQALGQVAWCVGAFAGAVSLGSLLLALITGIRPFNKG